MVINLCGCCRRFKQVLPQQAAGSKQFPSNLCIRWRAVRLEAFYESVWPCGRWLPSVQWRCIDRARQNPSLSIVGVSSVGATTFRHYRLLWFAVVAAMKTWCVMEIWDSCRIDSRLYREPANCLSLIVVRIRIRRRLLYFIVAPFSHSISINIVVGNLLSIVRWGLFEKIKVEWPLNEDIFV